ncbi:MAG: hypothetical protein KF788_15200 [Piscinibacter sp.]|nr:hypothetical protein [Piscinibacter sp.]
MNRKTLPPAAAPALSTRPSAEHAALALRELPVLMAPVARWLLRNGVAWGAFADTMKQVFVDAARAELAGGGAAPTLSALSVLSGVHRKDVRAFAEGPRAAAADAEPRGVPLASQVFTRWLADRRFRGRDGQPKPLPRSGDGPSFETLAREISQDVHPRTVLDELVRLGLVRVEGERLIPVIAAFVPSRTLDELSALFAANAADHLAAAVHNLTVDAPRYLEQSVFADGLSRASVERLHEVARAAWAQAFATMVEEASRAVEADAAVEPEAQQRMRFGVYFYGKPAVDAPAAGSGAAHAPRQRPRAGRTK